MVDTIINFTIPDNKISKALEGFLELYPNTETIDDLKWIDPEDGTPAPQIKKYTNEAWVKEQIRWIIIRDIRRGLQIKANREAIIVEDDKIIN